MKFKGGLSVSNVKFIFHNPNTTEETYEQIVHILVENILDKVKSEDICEG